MEDLQKMLENILSTEEGQKGFNEAMSILNGGAQNNNSNETINENHNNVNNDEPLIDPKTLLQIQSIFSNMPSQNDSTNFLKALKPLLKPKRQKKADEAIKMIRLFSLIPALYKSGLLKNFF